MVSRATHSLLPEERRWEYRRREPGRLGWFLLSLLVHALLVFFAGGWIEPGRLQTERPFVVKLVPPPQSVRDASAEGRETETALPSPQEPLIEAPDVAAAEQISELDEVVEETPPLGTPDVTQLAQKELTPAVSAISVPAPGDSAGGEVLPPPPVRRDVAGETAQRLLATLDTLVQLPRAQLEATAERSHSAAAEPEDGRTLGSQAGITGPLGRRGLMYLEHPDFPTWAEAEGVVAEARFKFWVSAAGSVTEVQSLTKSGHPEFDTLARAALMRWRFESLPHGQERNEWGEVRIVWGFPQAPTGPSWGR